MIEYLGMKFLKKYWIYFLVASLPFERIPSFNISLQGRSVTVRLSYIVAVLGLVLFGKQLLKVLKWRWTSPVSWLLLYLFVAFLSTIAALDVARAVIALVASLITIGTGLVVAQVVKPNMMPQIYRVLSVVTVVACLIGLYQFFGDSFGLSPSLTGLTPNYVHKVFGFPRIQSTGLEPLFFGNFLLIPFGLTLAKILGNRYSKWTALLLILITITIVLTLSRGTFYAASAGLIGLAITLVRRNRLRSAGVALAALLGGIGIGVGLIVAVTTLNPYEGRSGKKSIQQFAKQSTTLNASATSADSDRVVNRRLAVQAFEASPFLGNGLGNFGTYVQATNPDLYGPRTSKVVVNNEYLEVLAETGIAGAFALVGFVLSLAWTVFKRVIFVMDEERMWLLGLTAVCGGFLIQFYAFSTLYVMHIWVAVGLLMGLAQFNGRTAKDRA